MPDRRHDRRVDRPGVRRGYDRWARTYDALPNPLVALDERHTLGALAPRPGELVLDAACGTGRHLARVAAAGAQPVGLDGSLGMLRRARSKDARARLVQADLEADLPLEPGRFDAVLCALVGEHVAAIAPFARRLAGTLRPGGRLAFSVLHPELAVAGVEAKFRSGGAEVRLGAERHSVEDYLGAFDDAGLAIDGRLDVPGDAALAATDPGWSKYEGRPLLLLVTARRAA